MISAQGSGPLRFTNGFFLQQLAAETPISDGELVNRFYSQFSRCAKTCPGSVFVGIDSIDVRILLQASSDARIKGAVHGVHGKPAGLVLNQSGEAEPACGEPAQFKPGMTMDVACFETRECSTIQFAADRVWKHSIEARILSPIYRGPKFRKQTGVRKSGGSLADIRVPGWVTEYQEVTSLVKNLTLD
jgi:hypothetical protein